jgi:hypothetical protein
VQRVLLHTLSQINISLTISGRCRNSANFGEHANN